MMEIPISETPSDYIPSGCEPIIGIDLAEDEGTWAEVRGYFDPETGKFHIQSFNTGFSK